MSHMVNAKKKEIYHLRQKLLVTASMLSVVGFGFAQPSWADENSSVVWIELGGQLERVDGGTERFAPAFISEISPKQLTSPLEIERPSRYSNGGEGKITFAPKGSSWLFAASVRYGRTESKRHLHQEYDLRTQASQVGNKKYPPQFPNLADTTASDRETHTILDFQVGRDVGLGLFGHGSTSTLSLGMRMAEFQASNASTIYARPENHLIGSHFGPFIIYQQEFYNYYASASTTRSFHGVGPSLEWKSSVPLPGSNKSDGWSFDWGLNAAVLFGRQKLAAQHHTSAVYHHAAIAVLSYDKSAFPRRSRSVVVPNVGAFAGLAYRIENFKVALGYRGDFYFGAMDGGIDSHKSFDRDFYGPFAKVSFGFGG